jgi:hypothetical protein
LALPLARLTRFPIRRDFRFLQQAASEALYNSRFLMALHYNQQPAKAFETLGLAQPSRLCAAAAKLLWAIYLTRSTLGIIGVDNHRSVEDLNRNKMAFPYATLLFLLIMYFPPNNVCKIFRDCGGYDATVPAIFADPPIDQRWPRALSERVPTLWNEVMDALHEHEALPPVGVAHDLPLIQFLYAWGLRPDKALRSEHELTQMLASHKKWAKVTILTAALYMHRHDPENIVSTSESVPLSPSLLSQTPPRVKLCLTSVLLFTGRFISLSDPKMARQSRSSRASETARRLRPSNTSSASQPLSCRKSAASPPAIGLPAMTTWSTWVRA